jgi:diaminopimelate epimerase
MTTIEITKMSGAGNDFVVLHRASLEQIGSSAGEWVRRICRRGLSVGADGVLFVEPLGADVVRVEFRNPDGSHAFCANGSRCAARYARRHGMAADRMTLDTAAGRLPATVSDEAVQLELPAPQDRGRHEIPVGEQTVSGRFVVAGVPHFVIADDGLSKETLSLWGPVLRHAAAFGRDGSNVNLVRRIRAGELRIRSWERGVEGETLSCGSGAVAAAFVARLEGGPQSIHVVPHSQIPLRLEFPGPASAPESVVMTGDARTIFEGRVDDETVSGFPRT